MNANYVGSPLLFYALLYEQPTIAQLLLDRGADPNAHGGLLGWNVSALHLALIPSRISESFDKNEDVALFLITHGADVNEKHTYPKGLVSKLPQSLTQTPSSKFTPLMIASVSGKARAARALIEHGADLNLKTDDGWTALHYSVLAENYGITTMLLKAGARVEVIEINTPALFSSGVLTTLEAAAKADSGEKPAETMEQLRLAANLLDWVSP